MFRRAISSDSQERVSNGCCTHCDIDLTLRVIDTSSRFMHYDNVSLLYLHENGKYELNQVSLNWFALNFKGAFTCFGKVYRQTRPRPPPLLTETSKNVPKKNRTSYYHRTIRNFPRVCKVPLFCAFFGQRLTEKSAETKRSRTIDDRRSTFTFHKTGRIDMYIVYHRCVTGPMSLGYILVSLAFICTR